VSLLSGSGTLSTQRHHLLTQLTRLLLLLLASLAQLVKLTPCGDEGCLQLQGKGGDKQQQEHSALRCRVERPAPAVTVLCVFCPSTNHWPTFGLSC
jgi:hypothetical protein